MTRSDNKQYIETQLNVPLTVPVKASFLKFLLISVPHFSAIIFVIFFVSLPWFGLLIITILILFSFFYYARLNLWQKLNNCVISIHQDTARNWAVITANNKDKISVELQANSFISPFLVILNFKDLKHKSYNVIFMPDSLSAHDFRRLRVRIRVRSYHH